MDSSIQELLAAPLSELGIPAPAAIIQTMLMRGGYFAGWKFRFDGGYAVWRAGDSTIELHDEQGTPLKTVAWQAMREAA